MKTSSESEYRCDMCGTAVRIRTDLNPEVEFNYVPPGWVGPGSRVGPPGDFDLFSNILSAHFCDECSNKSLKEIVQHFGNIDDESLIEFPPRVRSKRATRI